MVVNECLKGASLVLFEIKYSEKAQFFIIHQAIKILSSSIHNDSLKFFDQKPRNILY